MRVEVKTAEAHGLSMPRSFRFNEREIEVTEILDQWLGAEHRYCKLKANDGALYILRLDENRSEWSLISEPRSSWPSRTDRADMARSRIRSPCARCVCAMRDAFQGCK